MAGETGGLSWTTTNLTRATTGEILCEVEAKIDQDMITGGPPEAADEVTTDWSGEHAGTEPDRAE